MKNNASFFLMSGRRYGLGPQGSSCLGPHIYGRDAGMNAWMALGPAVAMRGLGWRAVNGRVWPVVVAGWNLLSFAFDNILFDWVLDHSGFDRCIPLFVFSVSYTFCLGSGLACGYESIFDWYGSSGKAIFSRGLFLTSVTSEAGSF